MAFVSKSSDRVNKPRLCTKGDMEILEERGRASEFVANELNKIKELEAAIAEESAHKYPNQDFIASRKRSIEKIRASIAFYYFQRRK